MPGESKIFVVVGYSLGSFWVNYPCQDLFYLGSDVSYCFDGGVTDRSMTSRLWMLLFI